MIEYLRKNGFKIRVKHFRRHSPSLVKETKGGKTVVEVRTPDGKEIKGEAICSSKDNYSKKIGVRIALGRALKIVN